MQTYSKPRVWGPGDSPAIFLKKLDIVMPENTTHEMAAGKLREALIIRTRSQIEELAQRVTNDLRLGGSDPDKTYGMILEFLLKEQNAVLHPQMG